MLTKALLKSDDLSANAGLWMAVTKQGVVTHVGPFSDQGISSNSNFKINFVGQIYIKEPI